MNHHLEDKLLIERVLRGDSRAFGTLIRNTERLVAQIVMKMVPVVQDRRDLALEIYLRVHNQLPEFLFQCKLATWVARIAYTSCLSWIEKKEPLFGICFHHRHSDCGDFLCRGSGCRNEVENRLNQKELAGIFIKEIHLLSPNGQTLLFLFHNERMNYEEIAQITGLPMGTVRSFLFRTRRTLKENLLMKCKKETF
jgi:RNA polymerase sigma factor (sigma-70 family)